MSKALARMPNDRYASAAQFGKDAGAAVSGMPVSAPAPGSPEGATVLMSAAPAGVQTAATQQIKKTRISGRVATPDTPAPQQMPAAPEKKKSPVMAYAIAAVVLLGGGGFAAMKLMGSAQTPPINAGNQAAQQNPAGVTRDTATPHTAPDTTGLSKKPPEVGRKSTASVPGNTKQKAPSTGGSTVDSAGVEARMNDLTDPLAQDVPQPLSAAAKQELQGIYDNSAMLPTLRGKAARWLMNAFKTEGSSSQACLWGKRALDLPMPDFQRTNVVSIRSGLGCPQ
jgi:hypothetical protein